MSDVNEYQYKATNRDEESWNTVLHLMSMDADSIEYEPVLFGFQDTFQIILICYLEKLSQALKIYLYSL